MEAIGAIRSPGLRANEAVSRPNNPISSKSAAIATSRDAGMARRPPIDVNKVQQEARVKTENIARAIEEYANSTQTNLEIRVNSETDRVVVTVIAKENGRTIRQIPSEEMQDLAARMDQMIGVLFNQKV